jgi:hypothetical protein
MQDARHGIAGRKGYNIPGKCKPTISITNKAAAPAMSCSNVVWDRDNVVLIWVIMALAPSSSGIS